MFLIHISLILFYTTHVYSIKCEGENKCMAETIICSDEQACFIECSGRQACRDTTIICPPGFACNIKCHTSPQTDLTTNSLTCYRMIINATQSTILHFSADFGETGEALPSPRTFEDGQIYCPNNGRNGGGDPNTKPCNIYCNGDDLMRRTNIYAVEGFNDVHIESNTYDADWCMRNGIMRCLADFSGDCRMTNEAINGSFQCQDYIHQIEDTTCMDYIITTNIPTPNPTPIPSINTVSPSGAPTTPGVEKEEGGTPSGLSTTQLILAILLPLLAVACVCMGFGIYVIKKKSDSKGQHTSLQNEHAEDDEDSYDDNEPPPYNETKPQNSNGSYEIDSDESKSDSNTSTIDVGVNEKKGDDGMYGNRNDNYNNNNNNNNNNDNNNDNDNDNNNNNHNINGNNVQNGHNGRHKNTISDTYSDDEY